MASNIKVRLSPYGRRSDGSTGLALDTSTDTPLVSVLEVLSTLPTVDDPNNFEGRMVYSIADGNVYVFEVTPSASWLSLAEQVPVTVSALAPVLAGSTGELWYSTTTELMYLYDGSTWRVVGGFRGANITWRYYTGDGSTDTYATGAANNPPAEHVQVFVDGLAKRPGTAGVRDYYMVGNNVVMNLVPTSGQVIAVRTMDFLSLSRTANYRISRHVTDGVANAYDTGVISATAGQVIVIVDGIIQTPDLGLGAGTYDYKIDAQDLTISSMTASGTTVTVVTAEDHGLSLGSYVEVGGAQQAEYNGDWTVSEVVNSTSFKFVASSAPPSSPAVPNPSLYFGPVARNDTVVFYDASGSPEPLVAGLTVVIRAFENVVSLADGTPDPVTEFDDAGAGVSLLKEKVDNVATLKTLTEGANITLVDSGDEIQIVGDHLKKFNYTTYNGASPTYTVDDEDVYVSVRNSSGAAVTVDLSDLEPDPLLTGRFVVIKDSGLNAATHNIVVHPHPSSRIEAKDGSGLLAMGANLTLNVNGEMVCLVSDGTNWEMMLRHPGATGATGATGPQGLQGPAGTRDFLTRGEVDGSVDPWVLPDDVSYVGVKNTSGSSVTIDVYSNVVLTADAGRSFTIKDEGGNAATHDIIVNPGPGRSIDGGIAGDPVSITTDGGSLTVMFDGSNYYTI